MLKAVIFDMDGTLGDTIPLCVEAYRQCVEEATGKRPAEHDVTRHFGISDRGVLAAMLGMSPEDPALPILRLKAIYEQLHPQYAPAPFEGAIELLRDLRRLGLRTGLITGKEKYTGESSIAFFGFEGLFDWKGFGIPDRNVKDEQLQTVMQEWNLRPGELIYVGDAPSDIALCHSIGVPIINAAWAESAQAEAAACTALHPEYRLSRFQELKPLILQLLS